MSMKYVSTNGSSSELTSHIEFSGGSKCKSRLQNISIFLAVLFFATTIVFIGLYADKSVKYDDKVAEGQNIVYETHSPTAAPATDKICTSSDCVTTAPATNKICNTADCVTAAATMLKKMNRTADPCVDFNEYACGIFNKLTVIPEGATDVVSFSMVEDDNEIVMKAILTEDIQQADPTYLQNMKLFYMSCMDEDTIEKLNYTLYFEDPLSKDWPTISANWTDENFTLSDVISRYEEVNQELLFGFYSDTDDRNSSKRLLYLTSPTLGLSPEYFKQPRNNSLIMAYQKYLADTAFELGASRLDADQDAKDVVDMEIALSQIMVPKEDMRDSNKMYNPVNLTTLSSLYPNLDISGAVRTSFRLANVSLPDDFIIINRFPTYIGNITLAIKGTSNRTVQNLFGFHYAISRVGALTKRMREIKLNFDKVYRGYKAEPARWITCVDATSDTFADGMGKQYVDRAFPEASKTYMKQMIANLKKSFKSMIENVTWMNDSTKAEAVKKLDLMKEKVGYPDSGFKDSDISAEYEKYNMSGSNYYQNRILKDQLANTEAIQSLSQPIDKTAFAMASYIVNAQYSPNWNDITFPAGILQPPFFSQSFLDSVNYGAIGVVIGHEITHGFDDQGSQYDGDGNLRNWWLESDREKFLSRTQCIIDQNNGFFVEEIGMHVNGNNTQGESAADNGGVKESFRAYKELVSQKGEQATLPGLNLTPDQLFFLAFGQVWCDKITNEALRSRVTTNEHPPSKYRIIGPLQNSEDFAKAYNCPRGSYMNPEKKCSVW